MAQTVILLLTANPDGTAYLRIDREIKAIKNSLHIPRQDNSFALETSYAVTVPDLLNTVQQYKPQIVHFSGHGEGGAGLCFENDLGKIQFINAKALSNFFSLVSKNVRCVILNACYSEVQAEAIAKHIDYVIGMSDSITDQAAIAFSEAFYGSIGNDESIESAYRFACVAIELFNLNEEHIPKFIRREQTDNDDGLSENENTTQNAMKNNIEHIRQLVGQDKLEKALAEFLALAAESEAEIQQELIAQQAKLAKATKERRRGLIDSDKEEQVRNQIRYALLDLLSEQSDL